MGGGLREIETENATVASPSSRHRAGGRVARIPIGAELKGQIAAQAERARQARGRVAAELDLSMARGKLLFLAAQIEYVTAAGARRRWQWWRPRPEWAWSR